MVGDCFLIKFYFYIETLLAWLRLPPLRPASRASSEVNSCAVPAAWAALPPRLAISRCFSLSMLANPRFLVLLVAISLVYLANNTTYTIGDVCTTIYYGRESLERISYACQTLLLACNSNNFS